MALGYNGISLETFQGQTIPSGDPSLQAILADFRHADKIFNTNSYANAPKLKFLFHVYFQINPAAYVPSTPDQSNLIGILVRDVKLPSYSFNTHILNQYNRKRIVQTKIKYDPVNFTFHDDMSNTIAKMWAAYYTYYYADGSQPAVLFSGSSGTASNAILSPPSGGQTRVSTLTNYQLRTQYTPSSALPNPNNWGYIGDTNVPSDQAVTKAPFFDNITIFGLQRHEFLAYTLINPIITQFTHDSYNYDDGSGTMKNTMTLDYETVVYNEGSLDGTDPSNIVTGFGEADVYDRTTSPITIPGTEGYVISDQGVVDGTPGGFVESLRRPSVLNPTPNAGPSTPDYATDPNSPSVEDPNGAAFNAMYQNAVANDNNTRNNLFPIPSASSSPGLAGLAGAPAIGSLGSSLATQPANVSNVFSTSSGNPNSVLFNSGQAGAAQTAGVQVTGVQQFGGGGGTFAGGGASGSF
jgi:uncharacterized membrane protein YgcG